MFKKILIGGLLTILIGAVAIGAFDYLRGESALAYYQGETAAAGLTAGNSQDLANRGNANAASASFRAPEQSNARDADDTAIGGTQPAAVVDEWITVEGTVVAVELNAIAIETPSSETMLVQLGPENYWIEQNIAFEAGDQVEVVGFYEDEASFTAGTITLLETNETLALRDADGRPLWAGGSGRGNSNNGSANGANNQALIPDWADDPTPVTDLEDEVIEGLAFMREEEKLAHDVYLSLYDLWGMSVFSNIANSEQTHMDAILTLLDRYGIEDPAADLNMGEFTNPDLQALYDQLVAQGSQSLVEALRVGAAIEEIDILDLQEYLDQTDSADIQQVYSSLLQGSENHLRAFVSVLEQQAASYQFQFLSAGAFEAIVNTAAGSTGNSGQGGRNDQN